MDAVADFAQAASILRSYPGAVKDEADPEPYTLTRKQSEAMDHMFGVSPVEPVTGETMPPPEMQDDPRYLRILVACMTSALDALTESGAAGVYAQDNAISTFNTLFLKP